MSNAVMVAQLRAVSSSVGRMVAPEMGRQATRADSLGCYVVLPEGRTKVNATPAPARARPRPRGSMEVPVHTIHCHFCGGVVRDARTIKYRPPRASAQFAPPTDGP